MYIYRALVDEFIFFITVHDVRLFSSKSVTDLIFVTYIGYRKNAQIPSDFKAFRVLCNRNEVGW